MTQALQCLEEPTAGTPLGSKLPVHPNDLGIGRVGRGGKSSERKPRGDATSSLRRRLCLPRTSKLIGQKVYQLPPRASPSKTQSNIGALLDPLKTWINEFQAKIEDAYSLVHCARPIAAIYPGFWRGATAQSARHRPSWRRLHSERPVRRLLPHSARLRETCAIRACLLSLIDLLPFRHG